MLTHRSRASFGKRQEFLAIAELLQRGHDVYMKLVDDQQIDCVVRQESNGELRYLDIQIKARSKDCDPQNAGRFAAMDIPFPRENYYFIFYSEQAQAYWIVPSLELVKEANQNKLGLNRGKYSINFCIPTKSGFTTLARFMKYQNAFDILDWTVTNPVLTSQIMLSPIKQVVEQTKIVAPQIELTKSEEKSTVQRLRPETTWSCFAEIKKTEGTTLKTLKEEKKFDVDEVSQKVIIITPHHNHIQRQINYDKEFKQAYDYLMSNGTISRVEIQAKYSPRNPAYVAALLAQLPSVTYISNPRIKLFYRRHD